MERGTFFVLGDMGNKDPKKWDGLRTMLIVGASGSKIMVIT